MNDKKLATITGAKHIYEMFREPSGLYYLLVDGKEKFAKVDDYGDKNVNKRRVRNGCLLIDIIEHLDSKG